MFEFSNTDIQRLEELAINLSEEYTFAEKYDGGIMSYEFVFPDGIRSESVNEISRILGVKPVYIIVFDVIEEAILFKFTSEFDECTWWFGLLVQNAALGRLSTIMKFDGRKIYETKEEAQVAAGSAVWGKIKKDIEFIDKFLEDPWAEYRAKEKRFKEKLKKVEEATKRKIESEKKRKIELEGRLEALESDLLGSLGVENK